MHWTSDGYGLRVFARDEWAAFTGRSGAKIADQAWLNAIHPSERSIIGMLWREASRTGTRWSMRYRLRAKGGYVWVTDRGEPLNGRDGEVHGHRGTIAMALASEGEAASAEVSHCLEIITDHILTARGLAEQSADKDLIIVLDLVLFRLGQKLAQDKAARPREEVKQRQMA